MKKFLFIILLLIEFFPTISKGKIKFLNTDFCFAQSGVYDPEICTSTVSTTDIEYDNLGNMSAIITTECSLNQDCQTGNSTGDTYNCNTSIQVVPPPPSGDDPNTGENPGSGGNTGGGGYVPPPPTTNPPPTNTPPPWNRETERKLFTRPCDGVRAIWSNSFNQNGTVYKEASGYLVQNGSSIAFIAMPMANNTPTHSDNGQIAAVNGSTRTLVEYNGSFYPVIAVIHTHPLGGAGYVYGPDNDDYTALNYINHHFGATTNSIYGIVIAGDGVHRFQNYSDGSRTEQNAGTLNNYAQNLCR